MRVSRNPATPAPDYHFLITAVSGDATRGLARSCAISAAKRRSSQSPRAFPAPPRSVDPVRCSAGGCVRHLGAESLSLCDNGRSLCNRLRARNLGSTQTPAKPTPQPRFSWNPVRHRADRLPSYPQPVCLDTKLFPAPQDRADGLAPLAAAPHGLSRASDSPSVQGSSSRTLRCSTRRRRPAPTRS